MNAKKNDEFLCSPNESSYCEVEAIVHVDVRGQMVLPKELRQKLNIKAGDKIAISSFERGGKICCMILTRAEELSDTVKTTLGPMR